MQGFTTIQVDRKVLSRLKKLKTHPRQSYNELILSMISDEDGLRKFTGAAQKGKMRELWSSKEDEEWEHA